MYVARGLVCTVWGTVRGAGGERAWSGTIFVGTWGTERRWEECAQGTGKGAVGVGFSGVHKEAECTEYGERAWRGISVH